MNAVVRTRDNTGQWTVLGTGHAQGVVPENVAFTADEHGPATAGFLLRRDPTVLWPDIQSATPVQIEVDGVVVWGGRVKATPGSGRGTTAQIQVTCEGWRAHLSDDQIDMGWVHTRLSDYRDHRTFLGADLAKFITGWRVTSDDGITVLGVPFNGLSGNTHAAGVTFDLGPNRVVERAALEWSSRGGNSAFHLYCRSHGTQDSTAGPFSDAVSVGHETISAVPSLSGSSGSFNPGYRYVSIFMYRDDGATPTASGSDHEVRVASAKIFSSAAYESGGSSILKASNVILDVLASGAVPSLTVDPALITATTFDIPEFWPAGWMTPWEIILAVNAFHDYLVGVDADAQPYFRPRPTTTTYETGAWAGDVFGDAASGDIDNLHNRVIVEYTDAAGTPSSVSRALPVAALTAAGVTRTKRLQTGIALTPAAAEQLGDVWLSKQATPRLSGSIQLGPGDIRTVEGHDTHPSVLTRKTGELIALTDRADPQTGAVGRVGTITSVAYDADTETAAVALDNNPGSFEGLIARLAVAQGTG